MPNKYYRFSNRKKYLFFVTGIILLIVLVMGGLELTGFVHLFQKPPAAFTGHLDTSGGGSSNNQKGEPQTNPLPGTSTQSNGNKSGVSGSTTNESLLMPMGDFVSDHHPNLSGSPAPNTITSVCNTTPGASCIISFTSNGDTKSLPSQITNSDGSAYWNNWTLQSIGLTVGTWQIQATANLNGQNKTAFDAMDLKISP
ncbi:MAG: hypothetical protein ACREF5_01710 [Candidatus Saccharimonadales bacterium]